MKITGLSITLGVMVVLAPLQTAWGQGVEGRGTEEEPYQLDAVVVTAERISSIATVSEVTSEEIETAGADNLLEAVELAPAVTPLSFCPCKGEGELMLRGQNQKEVRILQDGAPLGETARTGRSGFPLGELPSSNIAKIKLIKGVPSVLYGSNSYGGVVNLITKRPPLARPAGDISISLGRDNTQNYSLNQGWRSHGLSYWIAGNYQKSDGFRLSGDYDNDPAVSPLEDGGLRDNADYERYGGSLKLGLQPSEEREITLSLGANRSAQGLPIPPKPNLHNWFWRYPGTRKLSFALAGRSKLTEGSGLTTRLYYTGADETVQGYTDDTYSTLEWEMNSHSRVTGGNSHLSFDLGRLGTVRAAIDHRRDSEERRKIAGGSTGDWEPCEVATSFIAMEDEIKMLSRLMINVGASYNLFQQLELPEGEEPRADLDAVNPQIGLSYELGANTLLHASAGRKSGFPPMKDLYPEGAWHPLFRRNFDLEAEEALSYELGASQGFGNFLSADIAIFRDEIENLIDSELMDNTRAGEPGQPPKIARMVNKPETCLIQGVEIDLKSSPVRRLALRASYTYLNTEDGATGETLLLRPEHSAKASIGYDIGYGLRTDLSGIYSSDKRYKVISGTTPEGPSFEFDQGGEYLFLNAGVRWRLAVKYEVFLRGNNMLDGDYWDIACPRQGPRPLPGRTFLVGMTARL